MSKSLKEISDVLRQIIEGKIKQASIGDKEEDKTRPAELGFHGEELVQENKETIPSGVESYDEEDEKDPDEEKELETTEGAENLLSGPSGFEGVPEVSDTPNDSPTSSPASVEKQSHIKSASTSELSEAAIYYASAISKFIKEASEDGGYLLDEVSPVILSRLLVDKVVDDARSRANVVGALLYTVKLAQEAETESTEEEEVDEKKPAGKADKEEKEDEIESEIPRTPAEEEEPPISDKDVDQLIDALTDLVRSEYGEEERLKEEEEIPPEEREETEPEENKGEIMERLLVGSPSPAAEATLPEEIKNASDEEILSATLDALLARGESLTDLASKGGRTGYRLAKSAEAYIKSGKYVPLSRLPVEKKARAKRLRDRVEDFIADLYNKSRG